MEIHVSNIQKQYNQKIILDIDNLKIEKGEIIGLIGNNGAGKTTLLRIILDLVKPEKGTVYLRKKNVRSYENWKNYTSAYLDTGFLIDFLTPEEYFHLILKSHNKDEDVYKRILKDLNSFMNNEILNQNKYIQNMSSGNKQKIGLIGALLSEPEILLLDEPFNFLDPSSRFCIQQYLSTLNKDTNATILISSHDLESIYKLATRIILIEHGKIIKDYKNTNEHTKKELESYFSTQEI
ncbi:MAG: ABC transporter ATP-binding protein [Tannerellaceae bacterium]|nr:ABC transporter ATP-binding protein [Tannerellaceae bacterium]